MSSLAVQSKQSPQLMMSKVSLFCGAIRTGPGQQAPWPLLGSTALLAACGRPVFGGLTRIDFRVLKGLKPAEVGLTQTSGGVVPLSWAVGLPCSSAQTSRGQSSGAPARGAHTSHQAPGRGAGAVTESCAPEPTCTVNVRRTDSLPGPHPQILWD